MTGGFDSVIGMDREAALKRFLTQLPVRLTPSEGDLRLDAVLVSVDPTTGRAGAIRRIEVPWAGYDGPGGARLLRGAEPAAAVTARTRAEVARLVTTGVRPTLALVSVGDDPASAVYLRKKSEACTEVGIDVRKSRSPPAPTTRAVVRQVRALGDDPDVHGILVQLPLAPPADSREVLEAIPPSRMSTDSTPSTPAGWRRGCRHSFPRRRSASSSCCASRHPARRPPRRRARAQQHRRPPARDTAVEQALQHDGDDRPQRERTALVELAREADLLVAAMGRAEAVGEEWVKPGATVVDVGIHRVPGANGKTRLTGDVDATAVGRIAGALTPVPGGVGPMTVAMVIANTVEAAARQVAERVG
jgi:methylenetetrahydrofolate dehydrogenase (NADP+)/methenyltetrahydrofolate cyclohydrolase